MKRLSIALTALAFVLASGSAISGSGTDNLAKGSHSNIKYVTMKDFHNQADLDAFMATAFDKGHAPDLGTVDWTKNMLFGLFAGYQQHSGYQIRITKVDDSGDTIQVFWKVIIPCEERSGSEDTQPFLFATFPASTKPVNINTPDSENQRC